MRKQLTPEEFNAVSKYTAALKLDCDFDIAFKNDKDYFRDFNEHRDRSLKWGLKIIRDAQVYDYAHDGMTEEEGQLIDNLFREFLGV